MHENHIHEIATKSENKNKNVQYYTITIFPITWLNLELSKVPKKTLGATLFGQVGRSTYSRPFSKRSDDDKKM